MGKKKILIGMSGGVDSSAAAAVLMEQGYEVGGCTMKLLPDNYKSGDDVSDAKSVCRRLGIEHYTFDFRSEFESRVIKPFAESYINGCTPNPCILCNKFLKFGEMLKRARQLGYDGIATGHYARAAYDEVRGIYTLSRPADVKKDQTYVLYNITQEELSRTFFPLADMTKEDVRRTAEKYGFVNSDKPDSQDICFVPDGDYAKFICGYKGYVPQKGNFIDSEGNILGQHSGIINYTIGQRRGLGVTFGKPVFVTKKNAAANTVTLGESGDLMTDKIKLNSINIISGKPMPNGMELIVKTRYTAPLQRAKIYPGEDGGAEVVFDDPVRAAAPGQACVFYLGEEMLGGGVIE